MKRTIIGALALTLAATTTGCKDMGLQGNVPLDQAEHAPPPPLVQAVHQDAEPGVRLIVDGRLWVPSGRPAAMDQNDLRAVGAGDGHTVYARQWDQPPFDALFIQAEDGALGGDTAWQTLEPVRGRTGPLPAAGDPAAGDPAGGEPAGGDASH